MAAVDLLLPLGRLKGIEEGYRGKKGGEMDPEFYGMSWLPWLAWVMRISKGRWGHK